MMAGGVHLRILKDGEEYGYNWHGISWEDWQRMLLGLAHGAMMLDQAISQAKQDDHSAAHIRMMEEDLDAIQQAYQFLTQAGHAIERTPEFHFRPSNRKQ